MATLGPTVREFSKFGASKDFEGVRERDYTRLQVWSEQRLREKKFGASKDFERKSERVSKDFEGQRGEQLRRE
jgi:hypothetical protein